MSIPHPPRRYHAAALVFAAILSAAAASAGGGGDEQASSCLRGVFLGEIPSATEEVVGRLGLRLHTEGGIRPVGLDHRFRSGDAFFFEITSNRDGWVQVLHRSPAGKAQILWPPAGGEDEATSAEKIVAGVPVLIPTGDQAFRFDDEVGEEHFYVAITTDPEALPTTRVEERSEAAEKAPPTADERLKAASKEVSGSAPVQDAGAQPSIDDIVNFSVRSLRFDPAEADDPYLYFAAADEDERTLAAVEFRLLHLSKP